MQHRPESYQSYHLITLITGPMFAGKSQELLNRLHRHEIVEHKVLLINSAKDNRASSGEVEVAGVLTTHRKNSFSLTTATEIMIDKLNNIPENLIRDHDAIGVDEGQFFDDIEVSIQWAKMGKSVYVAGLLSTSEGKLFGSLFKLIPFSVVHQLTAVCEKCFMEHGVIVDAKMTKCLKTKDIVELIGSDCYIPVCFKHWL